MLKAYSWPSTQGSHLEIWEDHLGCWESNPCWPHIKQASSLYYHPHLTQMRARILWETHAETFIRGQGYSYSAEHKPSTVGPGLTSDSTTISPNIALCYLSDYITATSGLFVTKAFLIYTQWCSGITSCFVHWFGFGAQKSFLASMSDHMGCQDSYLGRLLARQMLCQCSISPTPCFTRKNYSWQASGDYPEPWLFACKAASSHWTIFPTL